MDTKALRQFSYGVYLVCARDEDGRAVGCVVNTGMQLTSSPYRVAVAVNHDNATYAAIKHTRRFALCCLTEAATMDLVSTFGFRSSLYTDKFAGREVGETPAGVPFVREGVGAYVECALVTALDVGTHELFVGEVTDAQVLDATTPPMTYAYYHTTLKGTTPPKASAFIGETPVVAGAPVAERGVAAGATAAGQAQTPATRPSTGALHHFECQLCGYVYETEADELPEDFVCPMCGAGRALFEKID